MKTAMESIKEMVDVNTVVGEAVETPDGTVILPVSRVTFGFAAGGGEYETGTAAERGGGGVGGGRETSLPFGGGSGAGVTVQPVGFLVVGNGTVRMLPVDGGAVVDRLIDLAPQVLNQIQGLLKNHQDKKELRDKAVVPTPTPTETIRLG